MTTSLTDDPTSYLRRDPDDVCIMLAGNTEHAQIAARQYGVAIQVDMPDGKGIRVVRNQSEALACVSTYPQSTRWCIIADGLTDMATRDLLRSWFGPQTTIAKALGVTNDGKAWRPGQFGPMGG